MWEFLISFLSCTFLCVKYRLPVPLHETPFPVYINPLQLGLTVLRGSLIAEEDLFVGDFEVPGP